MRKSVIAVLVCLAIVIFLTTAFASETNDIGSKEEYLNCDGFYCPYCLDDLIIKKENIDGITVLICNSCGKDLHGFDPTESFHGAKYYGEYWYCDRCTSFLNNQEGFDDHCGKWTCTNCGYENSISYDMETYTWEEFIYKTVEKGDDEFLNMNYSIASSNYIQAREWAKHILEKNTAGLLIQMLNEKIEKSEKLQKTIELYLDAQQFEMNRQFNEAAEIYEKLGNYQNSEEHGKNCRYMQSIELMNNGDYSKAIPIFEALEDYSDSKEMLIECRYQYAESCFNTGDYKHAAELYDQEGQYKDSINKLISCFEHLGVPIHYFDNENIQFIHTKLDSGYSKNKQLEIKKGDIHYEWSLGQFIIDGFTQREKQFSNHPVFIKTLGDTVTLRFILEQNIECLHGNKNLRINPDKNTYDADLFRDNTDFNRGALIIRHTNSQNKSRIIGPYTDYLLAKDSTGANTKVILNQEGEYEVALDYEIKKGNVIVSNPYENYSIRFNFTIRNGDSPAHFLDCNTKRELYERDITQNGFSIYLANDNPLDIHVKCYSIRKEPSGRLTLNLDFDRIARSLQTFTKEGIYIVSMTVPDTKDYMEKTIFIGTQELRDEYDKYNELN